MKHLHLELQNLIIYRDLSEEAVEGCFLDLSWSLWLGVMRLLHVGEGLNVLQSNSCVFACNAEWIFLMKC